MAQRLDLIVACTQDPHFKYYMYTSIPPAFIPGPVEFVPTIWSFAFLTYNESTTPQTPLISPTNVPINDPVFGDNVLFEYTLSPWKYETTPAADHRIVLVYNVVWNLLEGNPLEEWTINGISYIPARTPLLQVGYLGKTVDSVVESFTQYGILHKTNIIHLVHGDTYEIVMIGDDMQQHPWHLHGFTVDFVAAGRLNMSSILNEFEYLIEKV